MLRGLPIRRLPVRAAVMRDRKLVVDEVAEPEPGPGQVLTKSLACGICGSDLHMLKFADRMVEVAERSAVVPQPDRFIELRNHPPKHIMQQRKMCPEFTICGYAAPRV